MGLASRIDGAVVRAQMSRRASRSAILSLVLLGLWPALSHAGGEECQNQIEIDVCNAGCSATEAVCGGLCDAGNGVCWVACETAYGTCDLACDVCDVGCDICCPTLTCNCGDCRDDCDDCHGDCSRVRNGCHDGCQLDCDECILNCERDCQSICRPYRKVGEFCTPLLDRCDEGLICWPIPFPGELRQRCFPSENDNLIDDESCRSFYSHALHEGAQDLGLAQSYGTGGSAAIGGGLSQEVGVVYSTGSRFGCYTTYCFGLTSDVAAGIYASVGFYLDYDVFQGESIAFIKTVGEGVNFSTSQIVTTDFELIGTADALSLGVSILPFDVGVYDCVTIVDTVGEYDETTGTLRPITNSAPLARCADRTVCADPKTCTGSADVNNESTDPDGDPLTLQYSGQREYFIGVTEVTLTVRDPSGLSDECQATVTVEDCTPPTIECPPSIEVDCEANSSAFVSPGELEVRDCTKTKSTVHDPAAFPIGETQITYTATDQGGLSSKCVQTITVSAPDSDGDGVPDCNDLCPTITALTPTGCGAGLVQPPTPPPPADGDGDGVVDELDQCPDTAAGVLVDDIGCPLEEPPAQEIPDTDSDGVNDDIDECPDTPAGSTVNALGCTLEAPPAQEVPDTDGDGIRDDVDLCSDTAVGTEVDEEGCEIVEVDTGSGVIRLPCAPLNAAALSLTLLGWVGLRWGANRRRV